MKLDATINMPRYMATLEASSEIGVGREHGLSRLALTDSDRDMRNLFISWCRDLGLAVSVDKMGNIFARRDGSEDLPAVMIGSHLDTQANGGRFDGIVGVLAGLEVLRTLDDLKITTKRPIEVVCWTNEEGSRFAPPMVGSGCFVGDYDVQWAHNIKSNDGAVTIGSELERIGYLGDVPVGRETVDSYFELHIEQGAELEKNNKQVGVVTHGYTSFGALVEFQGETAHTGPCPMPERRNALVAAARLLVAVDEIGWDHAATGGKATAARLVAWPNMMGILSDWAEAGCDVRHNDPVIAQFMRDRMYRSIAEVSAKTNCQAVVTSEWHWGGNIFNAEMVESVARHTEKLSYSYLRLPSQAGHDASFMAKKCPTAMIFTPCRAGITHNNMEYASEEHILPGVNVLLHAVEERANR